MAGSKFFTNKADNTLIGRFEGILSNNPSIKHLDSVVGFLRASGYFALRPFFNNLSQVRILIGIDVDKYIARAANAGKLFFGASEEAKEDYLLSLKKDIESSAYSKEVEDGMLQMAQDVASGKLELRVSTCQSIHAKIYILYPDNFNSSTLGAAAITGSSNLSGRGLGTTPDRQYEFNVQLNDFDDVKFAKDEFEALWAEASDGPISADCIKKVFKETYLNADAKPYDVYMKLLMEYFSERDLDVDAQNALDLPPGYDRYDYQLDAVSEGYQKLLRYDGFFLADVVGLGKTVIATMIAKRFCIDNGYDNTKILVVYPPAVEQNWKSTFHDFGLDRFSRFVSCGSLDRVLDKDNFDYWNADEYDLVLVDEAHKFRSHTTAAFEQLQQICKMPRQRQGNIRGYRKKVMLISATPMNNSPLDIYNQILLFQDPRLCSIDGVPNLTSFFAPLIKEFKKLRREDPSASPGLSPTERREALEAQKLAFNSLAARLRERVVKPITLRRTRGDIASVKRYASSMPKFPKVLPPVKLMYVLSDAVAETFEYSMNVLVSDKEKVGLSYARYRVIAFLNPEKRDNLYGNAELISSALAGIVQNSLVKRLESSFFAFKSSIFRLQLANLNMIRMFQNNKVFIAPDLDINRLYEDGLSDEEIEQKISDAALKNSKNAVFQASDFDPNFLKMLQADQEKIDKMCKEWENVDVEGSDDSKFRVLDDLLRDKLLNPVFNPSGKVVIFSESAETVGYLKRRISRPDVLAVSSLNRSKLFKTICENFDANCRSKKDDFNIIITTDALAEGINLHRACVIVNYDTPWNSTRLLQRIGRVNRIGSLSDAVSNFVFYPSRDGDKIIKLFSIALSKLLMSAGTFGVDYSVFSPDDGVSDFDPLDRLFDPNVAEAAEERNLELPFFEELRDLYVNNRSEFDRISKLSLRSRCGRSSGVVSLASGSESLPVPLAGSSLVFIKSDVRKAFYLVSSDQCSDVSALEALRLFKAEAAEVAVPRILAHHSHVDRAVAAFKSSIACDAALAELADSSSSSRGLGAQVAAAVSFVNTLLPLFQKEEERTLVSNLRSLAQRGVINSIAMDLQRMSKWFSKHSRPGGEPYNANQAKAEVLAMANKYSSYFFSLDSAQLPVVEGSAAIILSESFC